MGGCCCGGSSNQYPVVIEEHQPLSSRSGAASAISTGLLVDTNLHTCIPDTYRHPPQPIPYDSNPLTPLNNKPDTPVHQTNTSDPIGEIKSSENVAKETKDSDVVETEDVDVELKKSSVPFVALEECPTCLEEYDEENPKILTKCEHHFHLSCILEWMERSDTCPVCDKEMVLNFPIDE